MENIILINITFKETRVAVLENNSLVELYIERESKPGVVGNIYKGKVGRIIPGMQAAFIDLGLGKSGFISVEDVHEDSYSEFFLEEEDPKTRRRTRNLIQDILREGQDVLVQCLKEFSGGKGAKLSTNIALPGKYLVLMGNVDMIGISRRIEDKAERKRLQNFIKSVKPNGVGFIIRTASKGVPIEEIQQDMQGLINLWEEVKSRSERGKSPNLLYEEPTLYIRTMRDLISGDSTKIIVDSFEAWKELIDLNRHHFLSQQIKIDLYSDAIPIFEKFGVESEIKKILDKKVRLKSGGYLIIEETEALTVIDINTGKYTSGHDQEDTIFKTNMEAAHEVSNQIRLRNLVGIIVMDFIDIKRKEKREQIFNSFIEALKKDKARSVIMDMSSFGVVQMTRQRARESLLSTLTEQCNLCDGTGYVTSKETISYKIVRNLTQKLSKTNITLIQINANPEVIYRLKEIEGENLKNIENQYSLSITFEPKDCEFEDFEIMVN